jgi:hypothetical protein
MRQLLFIATLLTTFSLARAAESTALTTNSLALGTHGTLEIQPPQDWTMFHTNMNLPGNPPSLELHSPSNTVVVRLTIYWDGFRGNNLQPTEANMGTIVSNNAVLLYLPTSVEQKFVLEKLHGPAVSGAFTRFTDARWTPVLKNEYRNLATGMFRCKNIWGTFDLLTNDKDGPQFKQGLSVIESLRRTP